VEWALTQTLKLEPISKIGAPAKIFDNREWGIRLKQLRRLRGMSQRDAARITKTTRNYYSKVECAKCAPTIRSLERFAATFNVTVSMLLDPCLTVRDLATHSAADLKAREAFLEDVAALLPKIQKHDLPLLLEATKSLAAGQYTLPNWM
jgi:transcriptional regulator with XRE-family HTH domain